MSQLNTKNRNKTNYSTRNRRRQRSYNSDENRYNPTNIKKNIQNFLKKNRVTYQLYRSFIEKEYDNQYLERAKGLGLYALISEAFYQSYLVTIIKDVIENDFYPRKKTTDTNWNYYNAIAWYKPAKTYNECSKSLDAVIKSIICILHENGFDLFVENKKGENALESCLANHHLTKKERIDRYFIIASNISRIQISFILRGILNKLSNKIIQRDLCLVMYCLINNTDATITEFIKIAKQQYYARRGIPPPHEKESLIQNQITFFLKACKGKYSSEYDKDLKMFITKNKKKKKRSSEIGTILASHLTSNYDPCYAALYGCLVQSKNPIFVHKYVTNAIASDKILCAIKCASHAQIYDDTIKKAFAEYYFLSTVSMRIKFMVLDFFESHDQSITDHVIKTFLDL